MIIIWKGRRPPVSDEDWEEEQKRLDRQWYSIDEGFDESQNPFSGMSEDYTQRKEKELEQKKKKKVSARQRQIQKVNYVMQFMYLSLALEILKMFSCKIIVLNFKRDTFNFKCKLIICNFKLEIRICKNYASNFKPKFSYSEILNFKTLFQSSNYSKHDILSV